MNKYYILIILILSFTFITIFRMSKVKEVELGIYENVDSVGFYDDSVPDTCFYIVINNIKINTFKEKYKMNKIIKVNKTIYYDNNIIYNISK